MHTVRVDIDAFPLVRRAVKHDAGSSLFKGSDRLNELVLFRSGCVSALGRPLRAAASKRRSSASQRKNFSSGHHSFLHLKPWARQ